MPSIRLEMNIKRETLYPGNGRKVNQYTAKVGALDASAKTEAEARADLEKLVRAAVEIENQIVTMFDILEPATVWIACGDAHGWSYRIMRRVWDRPGMTHTVRETTFGGGWTREECLDRMRDHWYSNNVQPIVEGICALAGWGRVECKKCRGVTSFMHNPTRCQNPACGAEL